MEIKIEKDIPVPKTKWENIREYRKEHIKTISKLKVGESIVVKDRTSETVKIYVWWAMKVLRLKGLKNSEDMFLIKSINRKNQRVWRIE